MSDAQDRLIRALFTLSGRVYKAHNPSAAERIAVVAVGGYGRGTLAPGSDIDLLFLLPYKQTAWGESVVEFMLYLLWDSGFKVGHAVRSVDESLRLARSDSTIQTAMLEARYLCGDHGLYEELEKRFRNEIKAAAIKAFIANKLAERMPGMPEPASRAIWSSPTSRTAKAASRDLHTLFWIGKYFYAVQDAPGAGREGGVQPLRAQALREMRGLPVGGALPSAFPARPGRGPADLRHPDARSRSASAIRPMAACGRSSAS